MELRSKFASEGNITSIKMVRDAMSGRSKGYAYINFETKDQAFQALKLNDEELRGRKMKVSMSKSKAEGSTVGERGGRGREGRGFSAHARGGRRERGFSSSSRGGSGSIRGGRGFSSNARGGSGSGMGGRIGKGAT